MEQHFDTGDLATFYRSLQLLHSPKIESQRKLYNLLCQSIHKHHPNSKFGCRKQKNSNTYNCSLYFENSDTEQSKEMYIEYSNNLHSSTFCREPWLSEEPIEICKKPALLHTCDPRVKILSLNNGNGDLLLSSIAPDKPGKSGFDSAVKCNFPEKNFVVPKNTVTLRDSIHEYSKNTLGKHIRSKLTGNRHNQYSNPVNLKKIRAVLARGDPFPTYLTKAFTNNITPDLHREKL